MGHLHVTGTVYNSISIMVVARNRQDSEDGTLAREHGAHVSYCYGFIWSRGQHFGISRTVIGSL
jgi:hypothetical protein